MRYNTVHHDYVSVLESPDSNEVLQIDRHVRILARGTISRLPGTTAYVWSATSHYGHGPPPGDFPCG